jgi:hypothetical protein
MSHILTQWLNADFGLPKKLMPTDLELQCRNGYLFAQILCKKGVISDLGGFSHGSSKELSVRNFIEIEPYLKRLEIVLSSNAAFDIIEGKPGCAAKLLYLIKSSLMKLDSHSGAKDAFDDGDPFAGRVIDAC